MATRGIKSKSKSMKYYTVGVRFLQGENLHRVYTYRIRAGKKVTLGQSLVAETERGPTLVAVVRVDKTRQDSGPHSYKFLEHKVSPL